MYLYFDSNGVLKEFINDEPLRQGNDGVNVLYCYFEGDRIINGVYFNILKNGESVSTRFEQDSDSPTTKQIPYNADRDLKYFRYYTDYSFYKYTLTSANLSVDGLLKITVQAYDNNNVIFALGLVLVDVEASVVKATTTITTSEYEDLLATLVLRPTWSALETYIGLSRADLQGLTLANVKAYIDSYHIASVDSTILTGVLNTKITLNNGDNTAGSVDLSNSFYLKGLTYSKEEADALFMSTANTYTKSEVDTKINTESATRKTNDDALGVRIDNEITNRTDADTLLNTKILAEKTNRENADTNLQSQIDTIEAGKNLADIVGTKAELDNFNVDNLAVNDVVQVMTDETQGGSTSNYRLTSKSPKTWTLIGTEAPTYTKSESDSKFATKTDLATTNNNVSVNTTNIATKQNKTDSGLNTTDKTIVGAINELLTNKQNNINVYNASNVKLANFNKIVTLTQSEYDALTNKDSGTEYIITDAIATYLGTIQERGTPIVDYIQWYLSKASLLADYPTTTSEINETIGLNYNVGGTSSNAPFYNYSNLTYIKGIVLGSNFTSAFHMFQGTALVTLPFFDTSKITTMNNFCVNSGALVNVPLYNTINVTDMSFAFANNTSLVTFPQFYTSKVTTIQSICYNCPKLTTFPAVDLSVCTNLTTIVYGCINLNTFLATGMKVSFDISASTKFTESALVTILNNLATVGTTQTLTMGATNLAKLTDADKLIATNKGWTLA